MHKCYILVVKYYIYNDMVCKLQYKKVNIEMIKFILKSILTRNMKSHSTSFCFDRFHMPNLNFQR